MYCKECGFQLSNDAKFCPNCGTKVELNGVGNIENNAEWGTIESENIDDKSSHYINESAQWNQTVHNDTERVRATNSKVEEDSIQAQYDKTPLSRDIKQQSEKLHVEILPKPRVAIIKRKRIRGSNIFVAYWGYGDDNTEYPNQWYEDSNHNRISNVYYRISSTILNDTVVVEQNGKFAFAQICDNKVERVTKFVFEKYGIEEIRPEGKYYVVYSAKEEVYCYMGNDLYKVVMREIQDSHPAKISFGTGVAIFAFGLFLSVLAVWLIGSLYGILSGLTWQESQNSDVSKEWIFVWLVLFIIIEVKGIKICREPDVIERYYIKGEKVNSTEFVN